MILFGRIGIVYIDSEYLFYQDDVLFIRMYEFLYDPFLSSCWRATAGKQRFCLYIQGPRDFHGILC